MGGLSLAGRSFFRWVLDNYTPQQPDTYTKQGYRRHEKIVKNLIDKHIVHNGELWCL